MDAAELDVALEELETRLERLRALYEQYFMGLEKIEPAIARKDVDRRIYVLRREKIRNTAKRFKLQTIIQRYNTFQQYWQRICREIENGTYKRHLLKAQQKGQLLTIAARKRLGKLSTDETPAAASQPPAAASQPPSAPPLAAVGAAAVAAAPVAAPPPAAAMPLARPLGSPPIPKRPPLPSRPDAPGSAAPPLPVVPAAATAVPVSPVARSPALPPAKPAAPAPAKFESLDLDMDFMGDWDPGARQGPAPAPGKPAASPPAKPSPPVAAPPKPAAAAPPKPTAPERAAPPAAAPPPPRATAPMRPASIPPAPVAAPPRPASSRPPTAPTRPLAPRVPPVTRPAVERPAIAPKPAPAQVPSAAKPAPAAAIAPKPAPAAASSGGVDDTRLRDLHTKLQQAKQQTKEANVSYEGLAKSIRATEAKLREQHKNRKIEFDVVIKDGKAVVKPIVR